MITTSRLELFPLSLNQLIIGLNSIEDLSNSLDIQLEQDLFESVVQRAMKMKIGKMRETPIEFNEWFTYWLIVIKEKNIGVGLVGFKGSPDQQGSIEIGYGIDEKYRGNGYMCEAVKALIKWAFLHDNCKRVTATNVLANNYASQKVLLNTGFVLDSETTDSLNFSIFKQ
jgi:predicted acetyltransferase